MSEFTRRFCDGCGGELRELAPIKAIIEETRLLGLRFKEGEFCCGKCLSDWVKQFYGNIVKKERGIEREDPLNDIKIPTNLVRK